MTNAARLAHGDLLAEHATAQPDAVAIIDDRGSGELNSVTYRSLNELANRIANGLMAAGLQPGDRVAWCGRNCVEVLAIDYAAGKAGGCATGLNHRLARPELIDLLNVIHAVVVFVEADFAHLLEDIDRGETVVVFGGPAGPGQVALTEFIRDMGTEPPEISRRDGPPDSIGLSSGTTGRPKVLVRGTLSPGGPQQRLQDEIWSKGHDVFITSGAISSGASGAFAFVALARGGTVVLQRRFDAEDWLRLVDKFKVTIAYCAPLVIRQVCALPPAVRSRYDVSSIRAVFAGAAKWSYSLKLAYRAYFPEGTLWEIYGSSELGFVTVARPDDHWLKPESCGRPIEGIDVMLIDSEGRAITEPNQQGILYARTSSSFVGYENDPGAFAEASWGDGYFTVWDIAYFDEDGYYYISDRAKDMIVSGGINIYPAEIESVLDRHPGVLEAAVFGTPDESWGEAVHAVVVAKPGVTLQDSELQAYLREQLASHKLPRTFEFVSELPHTLSGKVLKQELRLKYWEGAGRVL
jgi:acyl-CoA synthetase (AMP-forming)/AMP-acid ligase II